MFVKETTVKRSGRAYTYLQLVDGYRDANGKVRHRVVANLGRKDALKDSGQLEALAVAVRAVEFDREAYRRRSIVECLIGWLKECRRVFSRFEKTAKNFGGMIKVAFIQR